MSRIRPLSLSQPLAAGPLSWNQRLANSTRLSKSSLNSFSSLAGEGSRFFQKSAMNSTRAVSSARCVYISISTPDMISCTWARKSSLAPGRGRYARSGGAAQKADDHQTPCVFFHAASPFQFQYCSILPAWQACRRPAPTRDAFCQPRESSMGTVEENKHRRHEQQQGD